MHGVIKIGIAYLERDRFSHDPKDRVYITKFLVSHENGQYSVVLVGNNRGIASRLMRQDCANSLYEYVTTKKRCKLAGKQARWKGVPVAMSQKFADLQDMLFDRYESGEKPEIAQAEFHAMKR